MRLRFLTKLFIALLVLSAPAHAGPLARIYISPGNIIVWKGALQQYKVYGLDADGNDVAVTEPVTWTADPAAGAITPGGLLTATTNQGIFVDAIRATVPSGLWATAEVQTFATTPAAGAPVFVKAWGNRAPGQLNLPHGFAIDSQGYIYICDTMNNRVQKFSPTGEYVKQWGNYGAGSTQFSGIWGIAVDAADNVYLADTLSRQIKKFDSSGTLLAQWLVPGASGSIDWPWDVAYSRASDCLWVDDRGGYIDKYTTSGTLTGRYGGGQGTADGQFQLMEGIEVGPAGQVYCADRVGRIQEFDANGQFVRKWGSFGTMPGYLDWPSRIGVSANGDVFVADGFMSRLQEFTPLGVYVRGWASEGTGIGQFLRAMDVVFDSADNMYVLENINGRIQKFDAARNYVRKMGLRANGHLSEPDWIETDSSGCIYVMDRAASFIQKFDQQGDYLTKLVCFGSGELAGGIAFDGSGNLYVACRSGWVKQYDPAGSLLGQIALHDAGGSAVAPDDVAVDHSGNILIAQSNSRQILKFSIAGTLLTSWSLPDPGTDMDYRHWLCVEPSGTILVSDYAKNRVLRYDTNGALLATIGSGGTGAGQFSGPTGVVADPSGRIYVSDRYNCRIQQFSSAGVYQMAFGQRGFSPGEFYGPVDVAVDPLGNLITSEGTALNQLPSAGGTRLQKFVITPAGLGAAKKLGDRVFVSLSSVVVTAGYKDFSDCNYVEAADRSSGIRITGKFPRGGKVNLCGYLDTVDGEKVLRMVYSEYLGTDSVSPVFLTNKSLGGADSDYDPVTDAGQRGVEDGEGANNIGLLTKTSGTVTVLGDDFFYIDDGTHAHDATLFNGVRVQSRTFAKPIVGQQVSVTGISRIAKLDGRYFRSVWPRDVADIAIVN